MKIKNIIFPVFVFVISGTILPKRTLSQSTDGDAIFDVPGIHEVHLTFTQQNFWDSLVAYYSLDKMMMASITIDATFMDSIGIQLKGNSSYFSYPGVKKSMKIGFGEYVNQKFDGLKKINLNNSFKDPTMMREKMMLDFCRRNHIPAPRCTYARVYLNGTYWGLYTMVEQVNKTFLADRFDNNDGNLFKGDPQGSLQWYGNSPSLYYSKYELKTNETANNWTDLIHLIDKINNTPSANFYDSLETVLDTWTFIDIWAANILFSNLDSYQGSGHNYYLYHDTIDNHFKFIIWDVNEAFGNFQSVPYPAIETMSALYIPNPPSSRPLTKNMLLNSTYKNNYMNRLCYYISNDFTIPNLYSMIDSIADVIRADVYADPNKMYNNSQFENNINTHEGIIPGLKSFISNRREALMDELSAYGCWLNINEQSVPCTEINIFPNPSNGKFILDIKNKIEQGSTFEVYNMIGEKKFQSEILNPTSEINSNLPSGTYYYRITKNKQFLSSGKFIVQ